MRRPHFTSAALGWQLGWHTRTSARFPAGDKQFTDEDILTILRAGDAGMRAADLCAALDIPVQMYYVWKVKYSGLTPSELRRRRRRERSRTAVALSALAVAVLGPGYALIATRSVAPAQQAPANTPQTQPPVAPVITMPSPASEPSLHSVARPDDASAGTSVERLVGRGASGTWVDSEDNERGEPDGYSVQVAAVPDLQEARALLEQLVGAGYSGHLTRKTVDQVEFYRVRVGPLESHLLAEDVARRLQRGGHRALWITK